MSNKVGLFQISGPGYIFSKPVKKTLTAINISAESLYQSVMRLYKPSNRFCLRAHVLQLTPSGIPTVKQ